MQWFAKSIMKYQVYTMEGRKNEYVCNYMVEICGTSVLALDLEKIV